MGHPCMDLCLIFGKETYNSDSGSHLLTRTNMIRGRITQNVGTLCYLSYFQFTFLIRIHIIDLTTVYPGKGCRRAWSPTHKGTRQGCSLYSSGHQPCSRRSITLQGLDAAYNLTRLIQVIRPCSNISVLQPT